MELSCSSCLIRSFRADDAPALALQANDYTIWINVRDRFPHPYELHHAEDFIGAVRSADPEVHFAIEAGGEFAGAIGIQLQEDVYRLSGEVGYWIGAAYRGQGIVPEALRAFVPWAFSRFGLHKIYAGVFEHNSASVRVLEKAGFRHEAVLRDAAFKAGQILSEHRYYRLAAD
ncbi:MAG: GNAT family protein [Bacteroidia bacterium]|nr:GNAT family protein [Bacteroidia bacterium]